MNFSLFHSICESLLWYLMTEGASHLFDSNKIKYFVFLFNLSWQSGIDPVLDLLAMKHIEYSKLDIYFRISLFFDWVQFKSIYWHTT